MPPKVEGPELRKYMGRRVAVRLNAGRAISGRLVGYDPFMNLTIEEAVDDTPGAGGAPLGLMIVRGASIVQLEALELLAPPPAPA